MKNDILAEIGMRIRQLRQKKGLTIEETAHMAGLHPNYLGDAERGKKNFSITTLEKVAKVLGVPVSGMFADRAVNQRTKSPQLDKLISLFNHASQDEQRFLIQTAKFIIRDKTH